MAEENQNQNQGANDQNQNQDNQNQNQNNGSDNGKQEDGKGGEAKFTQEDLNKFAAKIRAEEKAKAEKLEAEIKRQNELAKMEENERLKAEKEDAEAKYQELQKQLEYGKQKEEALKNLTEAKLDTRLIDVLMSDKSNEEKVKLMADIQKETVDKAIKEAMPTHNPTGFKFNSSDDKKAKYGFEKFK